MKNATQLKALVASKTWDKELLLWNGSEKELLKTLGTAKYQVLDLLDLFDLENLPSDAESTREQLRDRLSVRLKTIPHGPENRVILVVKAIGLLARYNVGLVAFYNWFIGDFSMVILLLEGVPEKMEWPEEIRCDSTRLMGYFAEPGMVKEIFNTGE
jgi:hypothetical protein